MDALTQVQIIVYTVGGLSIVLGLLCLKYLKPEPPEKDKKSK